MKQALLDHLRGITEEERQILNGETEVNRDLYSSGTDFTVDSRKMLEDGKLIAIRTHTRFISFPLHRHNYIEVLYVCEGRLTNRIGGREITVEKGEMLFLNQHTYHEILPAGENDIAINFMILPEFFDETYIRAGRNNVLADFLINMLRQDREQGEYLYFRVADVLQVQNLLENMIYSFVYRTQEENRFHQATMGLIFMYLLDQVQCVEMRQADQYENMIIMSTLDYIEQQYRTATLTALCDEFHLPLHMLSRMIKKGTGYNFKELLQRKRLSKAVELMIETNLPVNTIIDMVGYENKSYFHRVFKERYQVTPKVYRRMYADSQQVPI